MGVCFYAIIRDRKEDVMLFTVNNPKHCAFCKSELTDHYWSERGKIYCNEFCASDEEGETQEQLELNLEGGKSCDKG